MLTNILKRVQSVDLALTSATIQSHIVNLNGFMTTAKNKMLNESTVVSVELPFEICEQKGTQSICSLTSYCVV